MLFFLLKNKSSCSGDVKNVFLEIPQNSQENTCARVSFLIKLQVKIKVTLAQVLSCECCKISKNVFFKNTSGGCLYKKTISSDVIE